jgi:hypothetical protein
MCWVIGQLPCKSSAPADRVQGSASRKSEKDVLVARCFGSSLVQSCFLIEAQVQRYNYCYKYGGKGGVARID